MLALTLVSLRFNLDTNRNRFLFQGNPRLELISYDRTMGIYYNKNLYILHKEKRMITMGTKIKIIKIDITVKIVTQISENYLHYTLYNFYG